LLAPGGEVNFADLPAYSGFIALRQQDFAVFCSLP
jgi:hypothetical protein